MPRSGRRVHDQVAGLLRCPGVIGMGGDAEDVDVPGRHLHDEQHVQAAEEDRVHMEEVAGQKPREWGGRVGIEPTTGGL
jgi:hypothetical protein